MRILKEACYYRIIDTKLPSVLYYIPDKGTALDKLKILYAQGKRDIALVTAFGEIIKEI